MDTYEDSEVKDEPWKFTVLRAQGLHHLRSETWKPIVTLEVDARDYTHETTLGTDGQNTNQKTPFLLHSAHNGSKFELKIWHCPQSKKKGRKKRSLVACSSSQSLRELWEKQRAQVNKKFVEISLHPQLKSKSCTTVTLRRRASSGPAIHLRLQPPPFQSIPTPISVSDDYSDTLTAPPSPTSSSSSQLDFLPEPILPEDLCKKKLMRRKGYKIFSDDESEYEEVEVNEDEEMEEIKRRMDSYEDIRETSGLIGWVSSSILPSNTKLNFDRRNTEDLGTVEKAVEQCTLYGRLRRCETDSEFERVHDMLVIEWKYCAGLLVGLVAVDVTIFAITPDASLPLDGVGLKTLALSSILSVAGLFSSCNLLFWYSYVGSVHAFRKDIMDQYGSYFFFSISSRVPALCMLSASISHFFLFVTVVAQAWFSVIIFAGVLVGALSSLHTVHRGIWFVANCIRSAHVWCWTRPQVSNKAADAEQTPTEVEAEPTKSEGVHQEMTKTESPGC